MTRSDIYLGNAMPNPLVKTHAHAPTTADRQTAEKKKESEQKPESEENKHKLSKKTK